MIALVDLLRWLHVLGACVLIGTGAGIAFFMLIAHLKRDVAGILAVSQIVVLADMVFTLSAALVQPVTGGLLIWHLGWDWSESWIVASLGLYLLIGLCWIPVVFIQMHMRDEAQISFYQNTELSIRYHTLFKQWFILGLPAFTSILLLLWLMLTKPTLW